MFNLMQHDFIVGRNVHRHGWPEIVQSIALASNSDGIMLDDFIERSFRYFPVEKPYKFPWIGMVHHPSDVPTWLAPQNKLSSIFKSDLWRESIKHCKGLMTFSPPTALYLASEYPGLLVRCLPHPVNQENKNLRFNFTRWRTSNAKLLLQVGSFLRNTQIINQVGDVPIGYSKLRLLPSTPYIRGIDIKIARYFQYEKFPGRSTGYADTIERVEDDVYDDLLSSSVVIMEAFAANANNVVLECLARGTPLFVNRLPAIEYYLGAEYPLYFKCPSDVPYLIQNHDLIRQTSEYLNDRMSKTQGMMSISEFVHSVGEFSRVAQRTL